MDLRISSSMHGTAACIDLAACDALPYSLECPGVLGIPQSREAPCHDVNPAGARAVSAAGSPQAEQMQASQSQSEPQEKRQRCSQQPRAGVLVKMGLQDAMEHVEAQQNSVQGFRGAVKNSQTEQECLRGLPEAAGPLKAQQIPLQALQEASEDSRACRKGQDTSAYPSAAPNQSAAGFRHIKGVLTEVSQQPPVELESMPKACCTEAGLPQPGAACMSPAWQQARHSLSKADLFVSSPAKRQRM